MTLLQSISAFVGALIALGLRVVSLVATIFGVIGSLFSFVPFLIIALLATALVIPWVNYHDRIIEEAEYGLRTKLYPFWRDTVRDFVNILREIYNPLICWWNTFNWWWFGLFQEAIYPTLFECGGKALLSNAAHVIFVFARDFLAGYVATLDWLDKPFDSSNLCTAWVAFWNSWIYLYDCSCHDLGDILQTLPVIMPVPYYIITGLVAGPTFLPPHWWWAYSAQWGDPETCCFFTNTFNGAMAIVQIFLNIIFIILDAILTGIFNINIIPDTQLKRPDFAKALDFFCDAIACGVRSIENSYQKFWDKYIPLKFNFHNYLCIIDVSACIVLKTAGLFLTIIFNIDQCVTYPQNDFWERVIKFRVTELLNLWAPPTDFPTVIVPPLPNPPIYNITSYYWDTALDHTPDGRPNPMFGKKRWTECLCVFITRTMCDPADENTACFSQGAQELLQGLDFCCLFNHAIILAMDILAGLFEFTLHLAKGSRDFFLFVDRNPFFFTMIKTDVVAVVDCALQIFTLIPVVGECIKDLVVEAARYVLCMVDFFVRLILGLATLPYFLIEIPSIPNFLTRTGESLNLFVSIHQALIAPVPHSLVNCLCLVLNNGFPVPPIPCGSCQLGGFVTETREIRRMTSPWDLAAESMGWSSREEATQRVTPLIRYRNYTDGGSQYNPLMLSKMIWMNAKDVSAHIPFPDLDSVDRFVDERKVKLFEKFNQGRRCDDLKMEQIHLKKENERLWLYNERQGKYDECKKHDTIDDDDFNPLRDAHPDPRLTLGPTIPPLASCDPPPACFDLCCLPRAVLETAVHILEMIARFFNGFVQFEKERWGTVENFPYFTGEFCDIGKPCFESDIVDLILKVFRIPRCICNVINLIIPIVPYHPRLDLCCAIQRASELLACIVQVIVNAITALALGHTNNFAYFTTNMFYNDVSMLFDITLEVIECLCIFVRGIFPLEFIPGFAEATNFDICCGPQAVAVTAVEVVRWVLQIIISLATISVTPQSICYWTLDTRHGCGGTLDSIGFVKQWDRVFDSFLPERDGNCQLVCGKDQGKGGIAPCVCQIFNTLVPWRDNPALAVSCDPAHPNCQKLDFCCPMVKAGIAINDLSKFVSRFIVALWQSWDPGYPEFWVNYMFCDEAMNTGCNSPINTPACGCGTFTCGKIRPFINSIVDPEEGLLAKCTCEFFQLLDLLLSDFFALLHGSWGGCFCDSSNGILPSLSNIVRAILFVITDLVRKFPLICYWRPHSVINQVTDSWIFQFLGPIADSLCIALGNIICFVNSIFLIGRCNGDPNDTSCTECANYTGKRFLGGLVRWVFEAVFRIVSFIEGFIRQFTDEPMTCVGGNCGSGPGVAFGVAPDPLGSILTALLSFPVDALIGDSAVACSTICPSGISTEPILNDRCACWDLSPNYPGSLQNRLYVFETVGCTTETGTPCCRLTAPQAGVPTYMPICVSMYDISPTDPTYPGPCVTRVACRPDSLPNCASHPDTPPLLAAGYKASIDGVILGLLKYMACIFGPVGVIFRPLIVLFSIVWQILGGVIRFVSALLIFLLSLFNFSGGCDCHDYFDPQQNGTVKHLQLGALCYPCPNVNLPCSYEPTPCGTHCPVYSGSQQNCLSQYVAAHPGAPTSYAAQVCAGTSPGCNGDADTCVAPNCQIGGIGHWPSCGICNGCTFPANPLVLCSFLLAISRFFDVIAAFIAIFTQPIIVPELRVVDLRKPMMGPVMRENRTQFWKRIGLMKDYETPDQAYERIKRGYGLNKEDASHQHFKERNAGLAHDVNIVEAAMIALYDYDTSDCYADPVACVCRNFYMPDHCSWNGTNVVYTGRKRTGAMTPEEATGMVAEMFDGESMCDNAINRLSQEQWVTMHPHEKDKWVNCVNKRIKGERLHDLVDTVPANYDYTHSSPYTFVENVMGKIRQNVAQQSVNQQQRREFHHRNFERHWPRFEESLRERATQARWKLQYEQKIMPWSPVFDAIVQADQLQFKLQSGYYSYLLDKASRRLANQEWTFPTTEESLKNLGSATRNLGHVIFHLPYKTIVHETRDAVAYVWEAGNYLYERGVWNVIQEKKDERAKAYWEREGRARAEKKELFLRGFYQSPLYRWWSAPPRNDTLFGPFVRHMSAFISKQREEMKTVTFWNVDKKFGAIRDHVVKRWTTYEWTEEKLANWERLTRVYYQVYDAIWPNTLPHHVRERFIFNSNCIIADRLLATTLLPVDYCLNEFMPNLDISRSERSLFTDANPRIKAAYDRVQHYLNTTSPHRKGGYHHWSRIGTFNYTRSVPGDPRSWIRPKNIVPRKTRLGSKPHIDRMVHRRATTVTTVGPSGFNFVDWVILRVEDLFNVAITQTSSTFFDDLRDWLENPTTDINDYPNVGFRYWVKFFFQCEFPGNLNCSNGVGLEPALLWGTLAYVILVTVGLFIFPPLQAIIGGAVGAFIMYVVVIPIVAWHYSPRCWLMSPSYPLGGGMNVPIWPVPVAFPALPECAMDEIVAFVDKYITNCYSPLIIPPYMISGDVCPVDPNQHIDFINCKLVGVSDGIQNLLFLMNYLFGQAGVDIFIWATETCLGDLWPGLANYMKVTLDGFVDANETQQLRQWFCFWATIPTILFPLAVLALGFIALALVVPVVVDLIISVLYVVITSPFAAALPGYQNEWFDEEEATAANGAQNDGLAQIGRMLMGQKMKRD